MVDVMCVCVCGGGGGAHVHTVPTKAVICPHYTIATVQIHVCSVATI